MSHDIERDAREDREDATKWRQRTRGGTLQDYFERSEKSGCIDFSLRIVRTKDGLLDFYIHPSGMDGETGDFHVSGAFVTNVPDGLGAGSDRPVVPGLSGSK